MLPLSIAGEARKLFRGRYSTSGTEGGRYSLSGTALPRGRPVGRKGKIPIGRIRFPSFRSDASMLAAYAHQATGSGPGVNEFFRSVYAAADTLSMYNLFRRVSSFNNRSLRLYVNPNHRQVDISVDVPPVDDEFFTNLQRQSEAAFARQSASRRLFRQRERQREQAVIDDIDRQRNEFSREIQRDQLDFLDKLKKDAGESERDIKKQRMQTEELLGSINNAEDSFNRLFKQNKGFDKAIADRTGSDIQKEIRLLEEDGVRLVSQMRSEASQISKLAAKNDGGDSLVNWIASRGVPAVPRDVYVSPMDRLLLENVSRRSAGSLRRILSGGSPVANRLDSMATLLGRSWEQTTV